MDIPVVGFILGAGIFVSFAAWFLCPLLVLFSTISRPIRQHLFACLIEGLLWFLQYQILRPGFE